MFKAIGMALFLMMQISFASEGRWHTLSIRHDAFQYAGAFEDEESHLQYLNARYYNPAALRFISRDTYPLINRYTYAGGNPIMNEDPSGHSPVPSITKQNKFLRGANLVAFMSAVLSATSAIMIYPRLPLAGNFFFASGLLQMGALFTTSLSNTTAATHAKNILNGLSQIAALTGLIMLGRAWYENPNENEASYRSIIFIFSGAVAAIGAASAHFTLESLGKNTSPSDSFAPPVLSFISQVLTLGAVA